MKGIKNLYSAATIRFQLQRVLWLPPFCSRRT